MQVIQLYIDGQRVDMFEDESIQLTSSIQDVKDISKVFADYSQTFNVPASKNNNKIFKHYHNNAIQNGYDARFRSTAEIQLNHTPFKKGTIRLNKVKMKNNKAYSYELTFFGSMVSLTRILGDDKLRNLDLSSYNHEWTYENVLQGLQTGLEFNSDPSAVIYPLISPKRRFVFDSDPAYSPIDNYANIGGATVDGGIQPQDLKPALRLIRIIEAIEDKYPLTFSRDFFGSTLFNDLYMWMHRGAGNISYSEGTDTTNIGSWEADEVNSTCDPFENRVNFIGDYFTFTATNSNTVNYVQALLEFEITPSDLGAAFSYKIVDLVTDTTLFEETDVVGVRNAAYILTAPEGQESRDFQVQVQLSTQDGSGFVAYDARWYIVTYFIRPTDNKVDCSTAQLYFSLDQIMIGDVLFENQTPDLKIIDLLKGLFKMFNLTAYVNDAGTIVVETLNDYYGTYESSVKHDITKYLKVEDSTIERVPLYANIDFKFKDPETFLAEEFFETNGEYFGHEEFNVIIEGEYIDGENYEIELPFEKVIYERLTDSFDNSDTPACYGYFVNENQEPIKGNPLIFFNVNQDVPDENMYFRSADGVTNSSLVSYNRPSNVNSDQTQTLNFDEENDEFNLLYNDESLFKNFYKTYIEGVFSEYNRITKISALLPIKILSKYQLNDRFLINGESYRINSITSNLMTGNSELELIEDIYSVESVIPIPPTPPEPSVFYTLQRCSDSATGFRTQQEIAQITLSNNDRVSVGGEFYIVTGTSASGTSVGIVTNTGEVGCPVISTYYTLQKCVDSSTGWITGQETTEITLSNNDRVSVGATMYIVTGTDTTGTSVGTVTDTGEVGCPVIPTLFELKKIYIISGVNIDTYTKQQVIDLQCIPCDATAAYSTRKSPNVPAQVGDQIYTFDGVPYTNDFIIASNSLSPDIPGYDVCDVDKVFIKYIYVVTGGIVTEVIHNTTPCP
jgi:hypothetical protein